MIILCGEIDLHIYARIVHNYAHRSWFVNMPADMKKTACISDSP